MIKSLIDTPESRREFRINVVKANTRARTLRNRTKKELANIFSQHVTGDNRSWDHESHSKETLIRFVLSFEFGQEVANNARV